MEKLITLTVPCYNEEAVLHQTYGALTSIMERMKGYAYQICFVNDGSKDSTEEILNQLAENDEHVKVVHFSRNYGKEAANTACLEYADGDYVIILDADLQDPPELIPQIVELLEQGYDTVGTYRKNRNGEPKIRSFFAKKYYETMNSVLGTKLLINERDYRGMNRRFLDCLRSLPEVQRYNKALWNMIGFKSISIGFENQKRVAGESKYSLFKLFKLAFAHIFNSSTKPLLLSYILSAVVLAIGLFVCVSDLKIGWMTLLFSIVLFSISLVGTYIGRIFIEVKRRPTYTCREIRTSREEWR